MREALGAAPWRTLASYSRISQFPVASNNFESRLFTLVWLLQRAENSV